MRRRRPLRALGVLAAALALSLLACELFVRALVRTDDSGQRWVNDLRLLPYRLPLADIDTTLERLRAGDTFLAYDADLGWAPRPHARSTSGPFQANGGGIRAEREIPLEPAAGTLRIALFGDSFTFGDEVGPDETWGAALERALVARGLAAEVLNFGVNAYGMDQAFLRWRRDGRRYHPDVVLYGFQPENVLRNLNVFRPLYFAGTEVPLSKPRFTAADDALTLRNVPTLPPSEMPAVLATMPEHPLFAYERYYAPWYAPHWWLASTAVALLATIDTPAGDAWFRIDEEGHELAIRLASAFARDVEASGAAFLILHLPRKLDIVERRTGHVLWYDALLRSLAERFVVVDPERSFAAVDDASFAARGHYAPALNRLLGEALAEPVVRAAHAARTADGIRPASEE